MKTTRKDFLKALGAVGAAMSVPQAFGRKDGIDKYLTDGPDPNKPYCPIFKGNGDCLHYPVMANTDGWMEWEKKSALEIIADLNRGVAKLKELSRGALEPTKGEFSVVVPQSRAKYLFKKLPYGNDVMWYINNCWPKASVGCWEKSWVETGGWNSSAEVIVACCVYNNGIFKEIVAYPQYGI